MKFVKFFAVAVAALSMLAACEKEEKTSGSGNVITKETVKVYSDVSATGWTAVGVWAWSLEDESNYPGGTWPGQALTATETIDGKTYHVWEAPAELVGQTIGFIVNDFGTNGEQTVDLKNLEIKSEGSFVVLTEKGADGKWLATVNGEQTEAPEPTPEPVVVLGDHTWGLIGSFNSWGADVAMSLVDGWMVGTIEISAEDADKKFKIRANNVWNDAANYGLAEAGNVAINAATELICGGGSKDMSVGADGTYDLYFYPEQSKLYVMEAGQVPAL